MPNLKIEKQDEVLIGVWGQRHRRYLKEHHRVRYYNLLTAGTLNGYLAEIESQAQTLFNDIVMRLSEEENVTENLKATDPMEWVRRSNNIRNRAAALLRLPSASFLREGHRGACLPLSQAEHPYPCRVC